MLTRTSTMPADRRARPGFTLIELLVVISIVSLLIGILVPAISGSRESARNTKCLVNLRSIGLGLQMYMQQESKDLLPKVSPLNSGNNTNDIGLLEVLAKYLDAPTPTRNSEHDWNVSDPYRCPSDFGSRDETTNFSPLWKYSGTSYEYTPGVVMVAAELLTVPVTKLQLAVTKAYEIQTKRIAVVIDADNWHHPRYRSHDGGINEERNWRRNAVFFRDGSVDKAPFFSQDDGRALIADVIRIGGLGGG